MKRAPEEDSMDFHEEAARQTREMAEASRRSRDAAIQQRVQRLGVSPELAEYLVDLEIRIAKLEQERSQ